MTTTIRSATAADIPELARLRWQLYTEQGPHDESFDAYVGRFTTFATDALSGDDRRTWSLRLTDGSSARSGSRPCPAYLPPGMASLGRSAS